MRVILFVAIAVIAFGGGARAANVAPVPKIERVNPTKRPD